MIKHQRQDVDKIYLYVKDPFAAKYQLFEKVGIKQTNQVIFIYYSQTIDHFYENLEDFNATKKRKVLIVFDDTIADMEANKKLSPVVTELFLRVREINISLVFISQSFFKVLKSIRLNTTHCFIMQIPNKREPKQTALNHLSDIEVKVFMKLRRGYTK